MGMVHVSSDEIPALLDGELAAKSEARARLHLAECPSCSAEYAVGLRLDHELRQPPVLSCEAVLDLLSATFDGEASDAEQSIARRHIADCAACQEASRQW